MAKSSSLMTQDLVGTARSVSPRVWMLVLVAALCLILAVMAPDRGMRLSSAVAGLTLVALVLMLRGLTVYGSMRDRVVERHLALLVGKDATPCFTTDDLGQIGYRNAAATERFRGSAATSLVATLGDQFASPASVLYRLQSRAANLGSGREDVVTRKGHLRLSVHRVAAARFLWRLEEFSDRSGSGRGAEGLSLPMIVANKTGVVLFTNEALRRLTGSRPKRLDRLFTTPVLRSGEEVEVSTLDGPVRAILAEVEGAGERREIYLLPVPERAPGKIQADFENVPVALMTFRPGGGMNAANRAARELLGITEEAGLRFSDLFDGPGRSVTDWLDDVLAERLPSGSEVLRLRRNATDAFYQVALRRIVDQGRPMALAVLQDATALKTIEAQFVQSQKMTAIGQLAGGIAHDFNNLLTAISGHCDLLLLRRGPEDQDYADLVQIHQNSNRAAGLIGQLLAFSRKQTLSPEQLALEDVLGELGHLLNRLMGEKVSLKLAHAPGLLPIRADRRQLEQVFMNLVVNARDAMPDGGVVRIETEALTLAEPYRRDQAVVPPGEYSVIRVSDTGCGIPPDRIEKVFEPFFTTKKVGEGTGLGLSTVYGIVKQSGGFIFVDSEPGAGTTFHLYFPAHPMFAAEDALPAAAVEVSNIFVDTPEASTQPRRGEGVILLVEDEAPVRAFASRALRLRGYTVLEAENAEEALARLSDPTLDVDVFVTDVVMPGMDGPSWVREALRDRPNARVVFVSGYAEDSLGAEDDPIPNSVFLPKPFSLNDLAATVQSQLH